MKKFIFLLIVTVAFVGCDFDDDFTSPNYISFSTSEKEVAVLDTGSEILEFTVYSANISGSDRTFPITVDEEESTLDPSTYTLPESVTIPANSNEVKFSVEIVGAGIDNYGDVLVLQLPEDGDLSSGSDLTIDVAKVCPTFDPAGTYLNDSGWFEAEYNVVIEKGASENQYVVKDMFEAGTDITFTVNEDLSVTVPKQNAWVHSKYGQASVQGQAGSKLNPCAEIFTLVLKHTVSVGSFGTYTEVLTKQ